MLFRSLADNIGITVCGEYDEENNFTLSHYFPYMKSNLISSNEDISIERHIEKESYAGVCDDIKVGVSLIFYLQNVCDYLKVKNNFLLPVRGTSLSLNGLSCEGIILMPIRKNEKDKMKSNQVSKNRIQLIEAARRGDEEAIESLTLEDMDTYSLISRKIQKEDVFTLVDTFFMPYGVECDQYSILGEVLEVNSLKNEVTKEEIYQMALNCNDLIINLCINKKDLLGEPEIGRRFKGTIWLQGYINFPD